MFGYDYDFILTYSFNIGLRNGWMVGGREGGREGGRKEGRKEERKTRKQRD